MKTSVEVSGCQYIVTDAQNGKFTVNKDKTCSCGKQNCWHVREVQKYLKEGGQRASEPVNEFPYLEDSLKSTKVGIPTTNDPSPYKNPYDLKYWAARAIRLKELKAKMDSDGANNSITPIGQYWYDFTHLNREQMIDKWAHRNLKEMHG